MIHPYELKAKDVLSYTASILKDHLHIEAHGYCCNTDMILDILIKASAECSSVEAVCADLEGTADNYTIRDYLNQSLAVKELRRQEARANAALAECIPIALDREGIELAMDFNDEPLYGKQKDIRKLTYAGQAKKGTTYFVRIATAYIIWRQVRLTLAVRYILPEEDNLETLKILLARLKTLSFSAKILYLDKGFASTALVNYLTSQKQPSGTRALCRGRSSYKTPYTFTDGTQATIAMKASLVPDQTGKRHLCQ